MIEQSPDPRVELDALARSVATVTVGMQALAQCFQAGTPPVPVGTQIAVREVDGGVVLDVPRALAETLIQFGWQPPVDTLVGE